MDINKPYFNIQSFQGYHVQGTRIKGMEMALVYHEKASRTALQTGSLSQTRRLLFWYRHTHMTTVMESAEQCRQL